MCEAICERQPTLVQLLRGFPRGTGQLFHAGGVFPKGAARALRHGRGLGLLGLRLRQLLRSLAVVNHGMDLLCHCDMARIREDPLAELGIVDGAVHVAVESLEGLAKLARGHGNAHDAKRAAELLRVETPW
eukprot:scaffold71291_cov63-Phaeocystis_antarctica.AAC.3